MARRHEKPPAIEKNAADRIVRQGAADRSPGHPCIDTAKDPSVEGSGIDAPFGIDRQHPDEVLDHAFMVFESLLLAHPPGRLRLKSQDAFPGRTGKERPVGRKGQGMNQDIARSGRDHRPMVVGRAQPIDPVSRSCIERIPRREQGFDFQMFEPAVDRLPTLPAIARAKDSATEGAGIDYPVFPCGQRQDEGVRHALAGSRPGGAAILAAKEAMAERAGIDQIIPDRRDGLNAGQIPTGWLIMRRAWLSKHRPDSACTETQHDQPHSNKLHLNPSHFTLSSRP